MDASAIRRRYGELIQKIKSFRMAIGDYGSLLKVADAKNKPARAPSANRRTGNALRPVSGRYSQGGKVSLLGTSPSHSLTTGPLQISTIGNILQNGNSFSLADTITQARAMLKDNKQFRPFVQTETAVPPASFPVHASTDQLGPLQPVTPRRKLPAVSPKAGARGSESARGLRPPSCRRRREAAPRTPVYQPNVHIESPKFIRLLYEDLLRALSLLRTQIGRRPMQDRREADDGVGGVGVEWQQLDGLVSDLERQLRACEVRMLKAGAEARMKVETPPPSPVKVVTPPPPSPSPPPPPPPVRALSPVVSECGTDITTDTTTTAEEPPRTPWSRTKSLPSNSEWHQPIVPQNLCLRRCDTTLQASPRSKRMPRQAYPFMSSFPEVPPLPLLKQRTFVNVITGTSPTSGAVSRRHVKPTREKTWSY